MFSTDMNSQFKSQYIDEEEKHVPKRTRKTKKGIVHQKSDHNLLITEFSNVHVSNSDKTNVEVYNLKILNVRKGLMSLQVKQTCSPVCLTPMQK